MDSFPNLYRICYNIASILCFGFLASRHVGPTSPTRDWTQASCIRWQSLNHWTSREVPAITSFPSLCFTLDHQQQNPGTKPGIQSPRSRSTQPFPTSLPTHPPHPPATATQSISLFLIKNIFNNVWETAEYMYLYMTQREQESHSLQTTQIYRCSFTSVWTSCSSPDEIVGLCEIPSLLPFYGHTG